MFEKSLQDLARRRRRGNCSRANRESAHDARARAAERARLRDRAPAPPAPPRRRR
jgi:hypothetical protein